MTRVVRFVRARHPQLALTLLALLVARVSAQALTAKTSGDIVRIKASDFRFLEGVVLDRLKDGRAIRLDFDLAVLDRPKGSSVARDRKSFDVSLDLWEDRFAVTLLAMPPRSASRLLAADAEAWCLEQLMVPLSTLGAWRRDTPFWIRLEYRTPDPHARDADTGFTLRGLIDRLSRRAQPADVGRSVEAGPFRWSN